MEIDGEEENLFVFDLDSYTTNGVCDAPGTMRGLEGGSLVSHYSPIHISFV